MIDRNVPIPMRDGVILRGDIYRPDNDDPGPAIVCRNPYGKSQPRWQATALDPIRTSEAGFAVVFQDTRGRYESEGTFYPFIHEMEDGQDTIEWMAKQKWCNGKVGTTGPSYMGAAQWLLAIAQPFQLKAMFTSITPSEYHEGWVYQGGAFQLGFVLFWTMFHLATDTALRMSRNGLLDPEDVTRLILAGDHMNDHYGRLPLTNQPFLREGDKAPYFFDWLRHPANDTYWREIAINRNYGKIKVPVYHVGGWYDLFLGGTLENFIRMQQEGGSEKARLGQRLLIGPWAHGNYGGFFPEFNFGIFSSTDVIDLTGIQIRYFDYHLKAEENGFDKEPPVRIFIMGENRWRDEKEWPLSRTRYVPWYLHSKGDAGGKGGKLSPEGPGQEPTDIYLYDPRNPTPTIGGPTFLPGLLIGANSGPRDQRSVEERPDVLVYTSEPLEQPLEVTGPLTVMLYAATSAPDTDFVARLCDVYPEGTSRILAEGILRARFREGCDQARPITPGQVYEYRINLIATSNLFMPGHRIRVDVTSS
ncbi:MAG: CocE/NonD family hydrolase, partial [Pseudomonadota bacterium]